MRLVAVLFTVPLIAAQPAGAEPLQPAEKWVVDFGDNRCLALRGYETPEGPVHLLIKPSPIGDVLQLSIAEDGHRSAAEQEEMTLAFDSGEPFKLWQLRYGIEGKQVRLVNLDREQAGRLAGASTLRWQGRFNRFELSLGPMQQLMKVVGECRASLADHWNATPERKAALRSGPTFDRPIVSLFGSDDYPAQAVSKDQSGMATIVALIDEKGEMADCAVIETSGIAALDAQTCFIMRKRGKFAPAIGQDGKPAKGVFTQRIRWEMP